MKARCFSLVRQRFCTVEINLELVSFSALFVTLAAAAGALAASTNSTEGFELLQARSGTPSSSGFHSGYFYSWWTDNAGQTTYTNLNGGQYSQQWSGNNGNLVDGTPEPTGRFINYGGNYQHNGNSYLSVYGWTRNALIEYYIVESYGTYNPASAAQKKGMVNCNGASNDILSTWRYNAPSIDGTHTFQQFWSVRNPNKRPGGLISGSVDTGCHFRAWASVGMNSGSSWDYQIIATEGYRSSGSASITVS